MNRPPATIHEILGHYRPCNALDKLCENYTPEVNGHQQTKQGASSGRHTTRTIDNVSSVSPDKTAGGYDPMIMRTERKIKILPRNYQDWIRKASDEGVV